MKPADETAPTAADCYDAIRTFRRKYGIFRQRMLKEFVPILQEIEREAATTIRTLEELAPAGGSTTEAEFVAPLNPRKVGS